MRSRPFLAALGLSLLSAAFACSDDAAPVAPATSAAGNAGSTGLGGATGASGSSPDGGSAGAAGETNLAGAAGSGGTSTPPAVMDLSIVKSGQSYPLDRAQFGLTKLPEGHEIYVEAHFGGDPACPSESSPSPQRTLIITGLLAEDPVGTVVTEATHARANLFDFEGAITMEPILKGTAVKLTALESNACPDCAAGDPARFVAFAIEATFTDGSQAKGTVRASHCGSLDE